MEGWCWPASAHRTASCSKCLAWLLTSASPAAKRRRCRICMTRYKARRSEMKRPASLSPTDHIEEIAPMSLTLRKMLHNFSALAELGTEISSTHDFDEVVRAALH